MFVEKLGKEEQVAPSPTDAKHVPLVLFPVQDKPGLHCTKNPPLSIPQRPPSAAVAAQVSAVEQNNE